MKSVSLVDIRALSAVRAQPAVSLFAPNRRSGTLGSENRTQLRNLMRDAETTLAALDPNGADRSDLLEPVRALLDDAALWRNPPQGLALFLSPDEAQVFTLDTAIAPLQVVGSRFHVKPLWPVVTDRLGFYVLALSQKSARLYRGDEHGLVEVLADALPHSLSETLREDVEPAAQVRLHSAGSVGVAGRRGAVRFYGAATNEEPLRDEQLHYCQRIDAALTAWLPPERPPLVLAGVRYLLDLYRQVSRYPALVEAEIGGNVDRWEATELHATAWARLEPERGAARIAAFSEIDQLAHTPRVTTDLRKILPAACHGRIASLFVALDRFVWGAFDPETLAVHIDGDEPGSLMRDDLLDVAAAQAAETGATVFALPQGLMPGKALCTAVLRF